MIFYYNNGIRVLLLLTCNNCFILERFIWTTRSLNGRSIFAVAGEQLLSLFCSPAHTITTFGCGIQLHIDYV